MTAQSARAPQPAPAALASTAALRRSVGVCSLSLLLQACASATTPAADARERSPRRPERATLWPSPAARAEASPGWVVLRPPRARQQAERVVAAFFDAVRHESVSELSRWLTDDATISSGPGTTPESIAKVWGARFKQLDYGVDGGRRPYRADAVGVFTRGELEALERGYQLAPAGDELLAVVETRERERSAGPRHFGRRLEFVLGPVADGYRIRRMYEDFQTP